MLCLFQRHYYSEAVAIKKSFEICQPISKFGFGRVDSKFLKRIAIFIPLSASIFVSFMRFH